MIFRENINRRMIEGLQHGRIFDVKFGNCWGPQMKGLRRGEGVRLETCVQLCFRLSFLLLIIFLSAWNHVFLSLSKSFVYVSTMALSPLYLSSLPPSLPSFLLVSSSGKSPACIPYSAWRMKVNFKEWENNWENESTTSSCFLMIRKQWSKERDGNPGGPQHYSESQTDISGKSNSYFRTKIGLWLCRTINFYLQELWAALSMWYRC